MATLWGSRSGLGLHPRRGRGATSTRRQDIGTLNLKRARTRARERASGKRETAMIEEEKVEDEQKVIIAGGGPAGLLASILFSNIGIQSTVLERATEPDQWSTRSYTIVLNERGKGALERARCLESVKAFGMDREFVYMFDAQTGDLQAIPKESPGLGITRPMLVECLEKLALERGVVIRRGIGVESVTAVADSRGEEKESGSAAGKGKGLRVHLSDGACVPATHVIGADGKWSKVRQSIPSFHVNHITCPSFGVHMTLETENGWERNGTYVIRSPEEPLFYLIASPLHDAGLSITMVCKDQITAKYPWLEPPAEMRPEDYGRGGWKDEYSVVPAAEASGAGVTALANHLEKLFREKLPAFYAAVGKEALQNARINRRGNWMQMTGEEITFSAENGRVALIGDAAHSMTASMGEGCNTALESAARLVDAVENHGNSLSKAILEYGSERPKEVQPIQEMSAERNGWKKE